MYSNITTAGSVSNPVACKPCGVSFPTTASLQTHNGDHHQKKMSIGLKHGMGKATIGRDEDGRWLCLCGNTEDGDGSRKRMRRHALDCIIVIGMASKEGSAEAPGEDEVGVGVGSVVAGEAGIGGEKALGKFVNICGRDPSCVASSLLGTDAMKEAGVSVSSILSQALCNWCGTAINVDTLLRHLQRQHGLKGIPELVEESARGLLDSLNEILPDFMANVDEKGNIWPVEGLAFAEGFACGACRSSNDDVYCCVNEKGMLNHLSAKHLLVGDAARTKVDRSLVQTVRNGPATNYFPIQRLPWVKNNDKGDSALATGDDDVLKDMKKYFDSFDEEFADGEGWDARAIDMFLFRMGWASAVKSMDPMTLVECVAPAQDTVEWELCLKSLCLDELLEYEGIVKTKANFLLLRMVGPGADGIEPAKYPFRVVQERKTTARYADTLCRLILMAVRRATFEKYSNLAVGLLGDEVKRFALDLRRLAEDKCVGGENMVGVVERKLKKKLRALVCELFCKVLPPGGPRSAQIVHQFVMMSNMAEDGSWHGPEEVRHIVAALHYVSRSFIAFTICERKLDNEKFREMCYYVTPMANTPFCALNDLTNIAASVERANASLLPKIHWSMAHEPWSTLVVNDGFLSIERFCCGVRNLVGKAERFMEEVLLLGLKVDQEEWAKEVNNFRDDSHNRSPGYGVTSLVANESMARHRLALIEFILSSPGLKSEFFYEDVSSGGRRLKWRGPRVQKYLEDAGKLIDMMVTVLHIFGGGPSRGEELAITAHLNSAVGERNLYLVCGSLMTLQRYNKTRSVSGYVRSIARFFPQRVSSLLLKFLAFVKPLEMALREKIPPGPRSESARQEHACFLFTRSGKRMSGADIRNTFRKQSMGMWGVEVKFNQYRHLQKVISKAYMRRSSHLGVDEGDMAGPGAGAGIGDFWMNEQSGHSSQVARTYGVTNLDHSNATRGELLEFWLTSNEWASFIGMSVNVSGWQEAPKSRMEDAPAGLRNGSVQSGMAVQAPQEMLSFPHGSNGCLEYHHEVEESEAVARASRILAQPRSEVTNTSVSVADSNTLLSSLRKHLDIKDAFFKSPEQLYCVREALASKDDLLVVMPTGAGKTLIYMLPAWMEERGRSAWKCTVVVVPLISLIGDLKRRCSSKGVKCGEWADRDSQPTILFVAVEIAVSPPFMSYINRLASESKLARVVVEEVHTTITWESFRPVLSKLGLIRPPMPVPLILLTGTLPPSYEDLLAINFRSVFKTLRVPTPRLNLQYRMVPLQLDGCEKRTASDVREAMHEKAIAIIQGHDNLLSDPLNRSIVYCHTRKEATALRQKLSKVQSAALYHAGVASEVRKVAEERWRSGEDKVMVATSAFGTGIDFGGVRLVVHVGAPRTLMDYGQETGRAGRDGRRAICITILCSKYLQTVLPATESGPDGLHPFPNDQGVRILQDGVKCRREVLQRYLDGRAINCIALGKDCSMCDVCERAVGHGIEGSGGVSTLVAGESLLGKRQRGDLAQGEEEADGQNGLEPQYEYQYDLGQSCPSLGNTLRRLSQPPSQELEAAVVLASHSRRRALEIEENVGEMCDRMTECCIGCAVGIDKRNTHEQGKCQWFWGRCLRCFGKRHRAKDCPIRIQDLAVQANHCFYCGFAHRGSWGKSQCDGKFQKSRDLAFMLWELEMNLLNQWFPATRRLGSKARYVQWMFKVESGQHVPNVWLVANKWWSPNSQ